MRPFSYLKLTLWLALAAIISGGLYAAYSYGWISLPNSVCEPSCSLVDDPRGIRFPNGHTIKAKVADDALSRTKGLSGQSNLEMDSGMLFVFDAEGIQPMWMKGMLIDIDMIWLDKDYRTVHLEKNLQAPGYATTDQELKIYQNSLPARYVLEVVAGVSESNQLTVGDQLNTFQTEVCTTPVCSR